MWKTKIQAADIFLRAFMAWLITSVIYLLLGKRVFDTAAFAAEINPVLFILILGICFIMLNLLSAAELFRKAEQYAAPLLFTAYGLLGGFHKKEFAYWIAVSAVLALVIAGCWNRAQKTVGIRKNITVKVIYVIAAAVYFVIAGGTMVYRHLLYITPAFDFGIWVQMFHYMRKTLLPLTTLERGKLLSHFAVHFSPIYYLYLPFYALIPHALTLQIMQALTIISGMIPLYLICRKLKLNKAETAVFGLVFALYPAFATGCYYDLHENCFLVPVLMWLFWAVETKRRGIMLVCCLLTVMIKEDAPVYAACIGLYQILDRKEYANGSIVMLFSIASFLIVTTFLGMFGEGVMLYRYGNYMTDGTGGLLDVIKNFIVNPIYVIEQCAAPEKLQFLLTMFLPVGCLPLLTRRAGRYVLFIPLVLVNLASTYVYQYSMFYQYVFGSGVILLYLTVINYRDLSCQAKTCLCTFAVCSSVLSMPVFSLAHIRHREEYKNQKIQMETLNEMIDSIPEDASVSASTFLVPHLAQRDVIYEYPGYYAHEDLTDYIVVDLRWYVITEGDISYFETNHYEEIDRKEGLYLVMKHQKTNEI